MTKPCQCLSLSCQSNCSGSAYPFHTRKARLISLNVCKIIPNPCSVWVKSKHTSSLVVVALEPIQVEHAAEGVVELPTSIVSSSALDSFRLTIARLSSSMVNALYLHLLGPPHTPSRSAFLLRERKRTNARIKPPSSISDRD